MKLFAFDFETCLIQPYLQAPPIVCMSYSWGGEAPSLVHVKDREFWLQLWDALTDPDTVMVAHNASFEIRALLAQTASSVEWRRAIFAKLKTGGFVCTAIQERLIRVGKGSGEEEFGLDDCMDMHRLPHKLDKKSWWRLRFGTLIDKPCSEWPQDAIDYALGDVCVAQLFAAQSAPQYARFLKRSKDELEAQVALDLSSTWGFATDRPRAVELLKKVTAEAEEARKLLEAEGLVRWRKADGVWGWGKKQNEAKVRLEQAYAKLGKKPPRGQLTDKMLVKAYKAAGIEGDFQGEVKDDDIEEAIQWGVPEESLLGNISLDEEACLASRDPVMIAYTTYAQAKTLQSKVKRLQFPIIQCRFNGLGAASGRSTCSQGADPKPGEGYNAWGLQLQNPPRAPGIRECLIARHPGIAPVAEPMALVSCDFDTFELRTLTQQTLRRHLLDPENHPYPKMLAVLSDASRDVHVELGAAVYGLTVAEAYALKKTDKAKYKELRQVAKALNFGAPGGLGPATFVVFAAADPYNLDITEERAAELLAIWKQTWPEMGAYLKWAGNELQRQDPMARKQKRKARGESIIMGTEMVRGRTSYCDFCNNQFQGLAAAAAKRGLVKLMYAMYNDESSVLFGCRMVDFIHDEVIIECPLSKLHECGFEVARLFVEGAQEMVPDVPITSSPAGMLAWSKAGGDPEYGPDKRLVVWEHRQQAA